MPGVIPVTKPEPAPTVAIAELLLVQVPPAVVLFRVFVKPKHSFVVPVIAGTTGNGLTVFRDVEAFTQPKPFVTV